MALQEILAEVKANKYGFSKPFLFDVTLSLPSAQPSGNILRLFCHAASAPGFNVTSQTNKIYGLSFDIPVAMSYAPISFTFYVDRALSIPKTFTDYRDTQMFDKKHFSPKYFNDMVFTTDINVFDADNKTVAATYKLRNCFIANVSSMNLQAGAQNQIQEVTLTLTYEFLDVEYKATLGGTTLAKPSVKGKMNALINKTGAAFPLNFDSFKIKFPDLAQQFSISSTADELQSSAVNSLQSAVKNQLSTIKFRNLF